MELQLLSTRVEEFKLVELDEPSISDNEFELNYGCAYATEDNKKFKIFFNVNIGVQPSELNTDDNYVTHCMKLEYSAFFAANEDITDKFKNSHFPRVNAPAIAYPFLRAFIGTFLLNAGYQPVLLPSFNFSANNK